MCVISIKSIDLKKKRRQMKIKVIDKGRYDNLYTLEEIYLMMTSQPPVSSLWEQRVYAKDRMEQYNLKEIRIQPTYDLMHYGKSISDRNKDVFLYI